MCNIYFNYRRRSALRVYKASRVQTFTRVHVTHLDVSQLWLILGRWVYVFLCAGVLCSFSIQYVYKCASHIIYVHLAQGTEPSRESTYSRDYSDEHEDARGKRYDELKTSSCGSAQNMLAALRACLNQLSFTTSKINRVVYALIEAFILLYIATKAEAAGLKNEKFDLINEVKELYEALDDKEKQIRDFIRNYEHVSISHHRCSSHIEYIYLYSFFLPDTKYIYNVWNLDPFSRVMIQGSSTLFSSPKRHRLHL